MNSDSRSRISTLLVLLLLSLSAFVPAFAQEDDQEEEAEGRIGDVFAEFGVWVSQPSGLNYFPATEQNSLDLFGTRLLSPTHGTETDLRSRYGYVFPREYGAIVVTHFGQQTDANLTMLSPGNFVFGEILAHPVVAGVRYDGLADGFNADTATKLRDLRIDFYRTAFKSRRFSAEWYAGVRRVRHDRGLRAEYFAILPNIAPVTPFPAALVAPPETGEISSSFEGRGIEGGMDFTVPLFRDKLVIEAGFGLAVLRGETDSSYRSITYFYTQDGFILAPVDFASAFINDPPNLDPTNPSAVTRLGIEAVGIGLRSDGISTTSQVEDLHLGFRWKAWRDLELFVGFRNTRYTDVGVDLRPRVVTNIVGAFNVEDVAETKRSASYEGFYSGVAYSF